ncbi:hypothetical protein ACN09X_09055 [Aliarcobacter butzleri]|uniref:hypothetical protein n=1 Tax=Aliarcobacter butzleri TaxID=28197 RepID=UPI0021B407CA|nr:hypothetical protein [Aliarcobacter butzleri]MCT7628395.1 hypothetical protein [Aliarcobacter butzleri]
MAEKRNRSKNLTDESIEAAVNILDGIDGKLTWDDLIEALYIRTGESYTRQTLSKHSRIKRAYDIAKERIIIERETTGRIDASLSQKEYILTEKLRTLEAENERLKKENSDLLFQFARWAYNAYAHGMTPKQLDKELPPVDRGQD